MPLIMELTSLDTAEMYPVPAEATRYGNTERIIGTWIKKTKKK